MAQTAAEAAQTIRPEVRGTVLLPPGRRLNHLKRLEAESIYILREAAAEFARPVMLVFHRQRFFGDAAAGAEGVLSRQEFRFLCCTWTPATNFRR